MNRNLIHREIKIGNKEGEITNILGCGYEVTFFNANDGKTWVDAKDIEKYLGLSVLGVVPNEKLER